jgi:DNA-binding CsgD family transcriptional regulator
VLSARHVKLARDAGALTVLPMALSSRINLHLHAGELSAAASLIDELQAMTAATGTQLPPYGALALAAYQGREAEARELSGATMNAVVPRGEGMGLPIIQTATALLYNGLARYEDALAAAQQSDESPLDSNAGLLELIEAAAQSGMAAPAADALQRLSETTRPSGTDWARGVEARSRALLSENEAAEDLYREAIDRLGHSRAVACLARAHLLYGEWLRRERRRMDAREQLRTAHDMFTAMGLEAFAKRTERELLATGEKARKRTVEASNQLTAQQAQIARLAGDGLSNPEIGARLFISPRTVEYHLGNVFAKLDISSRNQLDRVLSSDPQPV